MQDFIKEQQIFAQLRLKKLTRFHASNF